jgi:hypothetical protein
MSRLDLPNTLINVRLKRPTVWAGPPSQNGELLKLAEAEGFDIMVTADQNLVY